MKTYLLSQEEVTAIEETMGIKLTEERIPYSFYPYIHDETYLAIDNLDNGDYEESVLAELRAQAEVLANEFIDKYVLSNDEGAVVTDAMDEIYNELREHIVFKANEIEDRSR